MSADSVTDGGAEELGYNLFVYAANNPVNNSDPSGNWIIKNVVKWLVEKVAMPAINSVKKVLSGINSTYSAGFNISGTPSAFSFNLQGGISVDTKGNIALQGSFSGGVTTGSPSVSATVYQTRTSAPSIDKLEGLGCQIGGMVAAPVYGVPVAVGGDFNIIPDDVLGKTYFGITTNAGFGSPGTDFHVEWGETVTWNETKFNIFDVIDRLYVKIMEW